MAFSMISRLSSKAVAICCGDKPNFNNPGILSNLPSSLPSSLPSFGNQLIFNETLMLKYYNLEFSSFKDSSINNVHL